MSYGHSISISHIAVWYSSPKAWKESRECWKSEGSQDHPNYSNVKINENTEESPGDFEETVPQNPVKNISYG